MTLRVRAQGEVDDRMFCVVNRKMGLIELVSTSAREEQQQERDFAVSSLAIEMQHGVPCASPCRVRLSA
jgi:hypothetical protein